MQKNNEFSEWLESNFIKWIAETGQRHTVTDFARWLDISRTVVSRYLSGDRLPTKENIDKIAYRLGPEIYDLLGLQRPDPLLQRVQSQWNHLTADELGEIERIVDNAARRGKDAEK